MIPPADRQRDLVGRLRQVGEDRGRGGAADDAVSVWVPKRRRDRGAISLPSLAITGQRDHGRDDGGNHRRLKTGPPSVLRVRNINPVMGANATAIGSWAAGAAVEDVGIVVADDEGVHGAQDADAMGVGRFVGAIDLARDGDDTDPKRPTGHRLLDHLGNDALDLSGASAHG
jgi:hypothetical protein